MAKKAVSKAPRSDASQESSDVGARAKSLRLHQRMTLDELAAHTGVSKGHLSRFERGQKSLSLAMLMRLADALHASVAELLGEPMAAGKSHLSKATGRTFRKATATDGGYAFAALSRSNDPMINSFVVEFSAADTEMRKSATAHHSGEEIFFVLEGAVEIELGSRTQLLNEGDYLQFPGSVKHNVRSVRKRSKVLVIVVQR